METRIDHTHPSLGGFLVGEIKPYALPTLPSSDWAWCDGSQCPDSPLRTALSNASNPFGVSGEIPLLPNLEDRAPVGAGAAYALGNTFGSNSVTLTNADIPTAIARNTPRYNNGTGYIVSGTSQYYGHCDNRGTIGGQAHENRQPSLAINFIIYLGTAT